MRRLVIKASTRLNQRSDTYVLRAGYEIVAVDDARLERNSAGRVTRTEPSAGDLAAGWRPDDERLDRDIQNPGRHRAECRRERRPCRCHQF